MTKLQFFLCLSVSLSVCLCLCVCSDFYFLFFFLISIFECCHAERNNRCETICGSLR
ncbi:Uncharacterized protein APZ42_034364 [Daphnia magna]|uniref:Uncharacterized protein n=1 Tax=Daphnia magna TaxID=35525 RepID=A0A164K3U9_9CRUS|nr:Uncharacterized protein APZ42_034364 [Daphnia magna]